MQTISSRRALLAGAPVVAAAALVSGAVVDALAISAAPASGLNWPAIVMRAEDTVDRLGKYYGLSWTAADQEAAAGMLTYCRDRCAGFPDDETAWKAALKFFGDYGQSLDWVFYGDPGSLIAAGASRSLRGDPAWVAELDPIFAVIREHEAALTAYLEASAIDGDLVDHTPEWIAARAVTEPAMAREIVAHKAVFTTAPTTVGPLPFSSTSHSRSF